MRRLALLVPLLVATVAAAAAPDPAPATASGLEVRYLGNEGFLIDGGGRRLVIDGLFGDGIPGYAAVPEPWRSDLEGGAGAARGVSVALATHYHGDHFDAAAVGRFLAANPQALFVSTPQAVDALRRLHPEAEAMLARCRAVLPTPGTVERLEIAGLAIDVLNLHHGLGQPPVENLGFVVHLNGLRLLHFGDTEAKMEDFVPYLELLEGTDLALLPFWFLASEWRAELVRRHLRPQWIVVAHTPLPDAPAGHFARWGSHAGLVRVMREAFPQAILPQAAGEHHVFGAAPP